MDSRLEAVRDTVLARNPGEKEFHQAVIEVFETLGLDVKSCAEWVDHSPLMIQFRSRYAAVRAKTYESTLA